MVDAPIVMVVTVLIAVVCAYIAGQRLGVRELVSRRADEAALRASEERYRTIVETTNDGVWRLDANGRTDFVNRRMAEMLGYTPEEMLGRSPDDFVEPEQIPRSAELRVQHRAGVPLRVEVPYCHRDGSRLWAVVSATPILSEGRYAGSLALVSDVTDLRRAEEAQRASEAWYRAVVERSADAIAIAQDERVLYANQAYLELLGAAAEDVVGWSLGRFVHPDDVALVLDRNRARQRGEDGPSTYDVRVRRADGAVRHVEVSAALVPHDDGMATLAVLRDVTERRAAEEALRVSEERFRVLFDAGPTPKWVYDAATLRFLEVNAAATALYGHSRDEFLAMTILDLRPVAEAAGRTLHQRKDGTPLHVEVRAHAIHFGDRDAVLVSALDVTERVQAETELREAQETAARTEKLRALGQLASGIAHDLNQSLAMVAGYSEVAAKAGAQDPPDRPVLDEALQIVRQAALDGGETVKRLLMFGRGAPPGMPGPVDASGLLWDVARLTSPRWRDAAQAEGRAIQVAVETEDNLLVSGRGGAIREALTNLVMNSVDAMPEGGTIRLIGRRAGERVVLEVTDTGVGMTEDLKHRVFEPFFTTKGEKGTGLGLAMVYALVEQHGGTIELDSTPGGGTTVRMELPAATSATVAAAARRASNPPGPLRVLTVDDEVRLCRLLARMLAADGHDVDTAQSGEEAMAKLERADYDMVISDLSLGNGINGWELCRRARARKPELPFVLATGWGAGIDREEARRAGVAAVVAKPYQQDDLRQAVAAALPA